MGYQKKPVTTGRPLPVFVNLMVSTIGSTVVIQFKTFPAMERKYYCRNHFWSIAYAQNRQTQNCSQQGDVAFKNRNASMNFHEFMAIDGHLWDQMEGDNYRRFWDPHASNHQIPAQPEIFTFQQRYGDRGIEGRGIQVKNRACWRAVLNG